MLRRGDRADIRVTCVPAEPGAPVLSAGRCGRQSVSRSHADIVRNALGQWVLFDLGSLNGCFVNRVKVVSVRLLRGRARVRALGRR